MEQLSQQCRNFITKIGEEIHAETLETIKDLPDLDKMTDYLKKVKNPNSGR
jgi:hypothetical protein